MALLAESVLMTVVLPILGVLVALVLFGVAAVVDRCAECGHPIEYHQSTDMGDPGHCRVQGCGCTQYTGKE